MLLKRTNKRAVQTNRNYQSSQMGRDHALEQAEELVQTGLQRLRLKEEMLPQLRGSHQSEITIAESIRRHTTVSQKWTAERLSMKSAASVSQHLSRRRKQNKGSRRLILD